MTRRTLAVWLVIVSSILSFSLVTQDSESRKPILLVEVSRCLKEWRCKVSGQANRTSM
jgi:hypothetical protein